MSRPPLLVFLAPVCLLAQQWSFPIIPLETVIGRLRRIERQENKARHRTLSKMFEEAGCAASQLEDQKVRGSSLPNIVCTLPGEPGGGLILVTAHFDKVRAGAGAIDNWSGASLLPSLYQTVREIPTRRHTFLFIGFTDEEVGLVGSNAWVRENRKTMLKDIRAVVNLDSVATGPHPLYIWVSRADKQLASAALRMGAALKVPLEGMNVDRVGESDTRPFRDRKIPVIDFHSLNNQTILLLHSIDDQLSKIDEEAYRSTYRYMSAYLKFIDETLGAK